MKSIIKCLLITLNITFATLIANAQSCPDSNHPHAIDLGLPSGTKWACCNVGATAPEGFGGYYAWGETEVKEKYEWSNYIHSDGSETTCHDIGADIAGTQYDVAHVKWGDSWVMPSQEQIQELIDNCSYTWVSTNEKRGGLITAQNGNTIFLPEALLHGDGVLESKNGSMNIVADQMPNSGFYWSSTQSKSDPLVASYLLINDFAAPSGRSIQRRYGLAVRPVVSGNGTNSIIYPKGSPVDSFQPLYDLSGRRLNGEPQRGVYIKDGKRVVIK